MFVTDANLIKRKWSQDIFVLCWQMEEILDDEDIQGTSEFEERTRMSREVLWHIRHGKQEYMPFDKADYILTKMDAVGRVHELEVFKKEKDGKFASAGFLAGD